MDKTTKNIISMIIIYGKRAVDLEQLKSDDFSYDKLHTLLCWDFEGTGNELNEISKVYYANEDHILEQVEQYYYKAKQCA